MGNNSEKYECLTPVQELGLIVTRLFPSIMCAILKENTTPLWLYRRFKKNDIHFVLEEDEKNMLRRLPNMDKFTIELIYKVLRYEDLIDEPTCKWGNIPHDTEINLSDDVQRILNATNEIVYMQKEFRRFDHVISGDNIEKLVARMDKLFPYYNFIDLYFDIRKIKKVSDKILSELERIKPIIVTPSIQQIITSSEHTLRYSRLSVVILDIFPNILRNIIEQIVPANNIYQRWVPSFLSTFHPEQQLMLIELQTTNSYDSLDITILYKLLRNLPLIPPPTKRWGISPDQTHVAIADDVERIRIIRNEIAHRINTNIDKKLFDGYFGKFLDICHRVDQYFHGQTGYEQSVIECKTLIMDIQMKNQYENALKELENIKVQFERTPITFYWGNTFETNLNRLQLMLKHEKIQGREQIHVQIVFEKVCDMEENIELLNSLRNEINEGLAGIEFIVASKGSIILNVILSIYMIKDDYILQHLLATFVKRVISICKMQVSLEESIDVCLKFDEEKIDSLHGEEFKETQTYKSGPVYPDFNIEARLSETDGELKEQSKPISKTVFKHSNRSETNINVDERIVSKCLEKFISLHGEEFKETQTYKSGPVYLDFNIEARLFETDGELKEQLKHISKKVFKHLNRSGTNTNVAACILSESLENIATKEISFAQAQAAVKCSLPNSVILHRKLNISETENYHISGCIKMGNKIVFPDAYKKRLVIYDLYHTDVNHISLLYEPFYITEVDSNDVAVSCKNDRKILLVNISTGDVTNTINTRGNCYGIACVNNSMHVIIHKSMIQVIDLTGKVKHTLDIPSDRTYDITIYDDRLVSIDNKSIHCQSLNGKHMWDFQNEKYKSFRGLTTDREGNVYVTDEDTNTTVVVSEDGKYHKEILSEFDELCIPTGIHFDKKHNILVICNATDGKVFLFDVKKTA